MHYIYITSYMCWQKHKPVNEQDPRGFLCDFNFHFYTYLRFENFLQSASITTKVKTKRNNKALWRCKNIPLFLHWLIHLCVPSFTHQPYLCSFYFSQHYAGHCGESVLKNRGCQAQWVTPVIPGLWEAEVGASRGREMETLLANVVKPRLYKNTKISWAWWHVPVILATWEAEAEESLEPRSSRRAWETWRDLVSIIFF